MVSWENMIAPGYGYDWALNVNDKIKNYILEDNHIPLIHYENFGKEGEYAIPTPEHYLPLLYTLGLKNTHDQVSFMNDIPIGGS